MNRLKRRCKCGCGEITSAGKKWISGHHSRSKNPNYKHGLRYHKIYTVWCNMKARCYNIKHYHYNDYGGRGIRVYIRWRVNFKSFYNWAITHGWKEGLEIDRIDNDGNYSPDNCRCVTHQVNVNNQRMRKDNKTGYIGVYLQNNKYRAYPTINGKLKHLGYFDTAEEAAIAIQRRV